ncbi:MAG: flagellar hook-associated protein FlgL [Lachnospiraceae bacterium]|nr:flagellar hook-associated protein FlgL [Lachnospiraceae bacterium]
MRVTNQMVTSGSLRNMQKSMQRVDNLNNQVTTGKKISAPSEDPVIAIRALKLRTTVDQLDQYKNKNIKDALSWLDTTQTSVQNVYDRLQDVYYYCEQGAQDTFQTKDRHTIIDELHELKDAIYREGGTTYAGRYLFSGYKTETNLIFQDNAAKQGLAYNINEEIDPAKFVGKTVVLNEVNANAINDIMTGTATYTSPSVDSVYQLRLAYSDLDKGTADITISVTNADGTVTNIGPNIKQVADSATYYDVSDDEVNYIPETGELIFGKNVYNTVKDAISVNVNYNKSSFAVGDLRPEMYFNCTQHKTLSDGTIKDTEFTVEEEGQPIQYEVNFSQYITVNAQGKDFILHDMGNKIEDLANSVQSVLDIEDTISRLKELQEDPQYKNDPDAMKQLDKMLEDADVELAQKRETMQKLFGNNMTNFQNFMETVSAVQAKVGTTYSKLELIETRVTEQLANFKELKSSNEDVETEEAAIEMYQAELVYESALATTSSVIKKTLLDYI